MANKKEQLAEAVKKAQERGNDWDLSLLATIDPDSMTEGDLSLIRAIIYRA